MSQKEKILVSIYFQTKIPKVQTKNIQMYGRFMLTILKPAKFEFRKYGHIIMGIQYIGSKIGRGVHTNLLMFTGDKHGV